MQVLLDFVLQLEFVCCSRKLYVLQQLCMALYVAAETLCIAAEALYVAIASFVCCNRNFVCCNIGFMCCNISFVCCSRSFICCSRSLVYNISFACCSKSFVCCSRRQQKLALKSVRAVQYTSFSSSCTLIKVIFALNLIKCHCQYPNLPLKKELSLNSDFGQFIN